jgi:hypothetical protein
VKPAVTYTRVRESSGAPSGRAGTQLKARRRVVRIRQVGNEEPLVGAEAICNGAHHALHRAVVTLKNHGCVSARFFNVRDSLRGDLHLKVADSSSQLPWSYVLLHCYLVDNDRGEVFCGERCVDLTDLDMSRARALL